MQRKKYVMHIYTSLGSCVASFKHIYYPQLFMGRKKRNMSTAPNTLCLFPSFTHVPLGNWVIVHWINCLTHEMTKGCNNQFIGLVHQNSQSTRIVFKVKLMVNYVHLVTVAEYVTIMCVPLLGYISYVLQDLVVQMAQLREHC